MRTQTTVFNTLHFPVKVAKHVFPPWEEVSIILDTASRTGRAIRSVKGLRVGKHNNKQWKARHIPDKIYDFNMAYDTRSQHRGFAYARAIEALASPMIKHLPEQSAGFTDIPAPTINVRFFSSLRIREHGKIPVGPNDVFYSHGIGDKNYWIAPHIEDFRFAMVPGPAWKERIEKGGYRGKVFVVGYTKLDPLFNGEYVRQKREKPYVVWAPTHGYTAKHKGRSSYPACMTLFPEIPDTYEKTLALHPTSRLGLKKGQDVTMQELIDADVVIADAGSTLYEAWALGKPVIFPDWLCKADILSRFSPGNLEYEIYKKGIGYHAKDMNHLINLIDTALGDGMREPEIEFMETVFPSELRGKAGEKAAEALLEIKEGVGQ